jgi:hypothetical protein
MNATLMSSFAFDKPGIMAQTPPELLSEVARGLGRVNFFRNDFSRLEARQ